SYYKMQTMNQSLMALVLNGVVKKEVAMSVSSNPTELDMELRKFLYAVEKPARAVGEDEVPEVSIADFMEAGEGGVQAPGVDMAQPLSDYSKIVELQEIRKLYEESREKHSRELGDKDEAIQRLEDDVRTKDQEIQDMTEQIQVGVQEREK